MALRRERFESRFGSRAERLASSFAAARLERAESVARAFRAAKRAARSVEVLEVVVEDGSGGF